MDHVLHTIAAGMGYPLPTGHKLPFHVFPEGVTHTAMAARQTHSCPYCLTHVSPLTMGRITPVQRSNVSKVVRVWLGLVGCHGGRRDSFWVDVAWQLMTV